MPVRQWFPNAPIVLLRAPCRDTMTATFRVGKDMSKPDLKEYLTKVRAFGQTLEINLGASPLRSRRLITPYLC